MQRYIKNRKKRNDVINIINRCIIIKIKKKTYKRKRQKNLLEVYTDKENVKYISDVCIEQLVFTKRGRQVRQKVSFEPKGKFKWSNGNESTKSVCEGRRKHEVHIGLEREATEISEKKSVQEG